MKKWYMLASCFLFSGVMMAQGLSGFPAGNPKASVVKSKEVEVSKVKPNPQAMNKDQMDIVFTEDFANGLDGNNELSMPWTVGGINGDLWEQNFDGPTGQFSSNIGPLESATAANGFMLIDCDLYNTDLSNVQDVQAWIVSPELDLSALSSVLVDYTTYYRYCCFATPMPCQLGVSVDGGTSWTDFPMYGYNQFIVQANNLSGTLDVTTDISAVAANQSSVLIRYAYNPDLNGSFSHYFLGVDDIAVYENPYANNLAVLQVMNNDVLNLWEIKNYPLEQSNDILAGCVYANYGSADQTNVEITFEVLDADNNVLSSTVEALGTVPSNSLDTVYHETGYALADLGNYRVRATISADETEEVPENIMGERAITLTTSVMSYDDLENLDIQNGPRDNDAGDGFEEGGFGIYLFVESAGSLAHGVQMVFGDNTTPGSDVLIELYEVDPAVGVNDNNNDNFPVDLLTSAEFVVTEADYDQEVYVPFDDQIELELDKLYFVSILQFEGDQEVWLRATFNTDTDNSSYVRELSGSGAPTWFSRPDENAMRLALNMTLNVEDISSVKESMTVSPNPFNESTLISYTLDMDKMVSYKLYDINGRLIEDVKLGNQGAGNHQITVEAADLEAGVYYFNLRIGNSAVTEKLVITK
jgi:hypothetical protein